MYRFAIYVDIKVDDPQQAFDTGVNVAEHIADTFNDDGSIDAVWFDPSTLTEVKDMPC